MELLLIWLLIWLGFGLVGGLILSSKGRSGCGGFGL
jgi:hypothetical protein